ncbi:hypothetical protein TWF718_001823 [Orbilia javanica]|uniref:Dynamin N-terminal domain-containing protein n=1 Tax=Orbilia javanica TaxID=47235 RepID=A0AAN8NIF8_9PEZI
MPAKSVHPSVAAFKNDSHSVEKRLEYLFTEGQNFLKSCSAQLQYMSDHGLLDKGGKRVQKHVHKYQDVQLGSKAIIAFIGESGAGKSTLLNALLNRENIVPTSGIRACTSVATEFSSRTPTMKSQFHAVIEFVGREEFEKEVEILRYDIAGEDETQFDAEDGYCMLSESEDEENKNVVNIPVPKRRRLSDSSSAAAAEVARDKMKALFPGFQDSDLSRVTTMVQELYAKNEALTAGKQFLEDDDEDEFVEQVHKMIANRGDEEDTEPQLWPLIKIMRIHLDAEVLDGDAILVDLPGLKDDNAARAAVAQSYLAKANEVIIVSRLARALTDETTAALAEMGYTKQLQFDGRKRITIVCSFCDLFRLNDARQEFKNIKGFCASYEVLSKRAKPQRELKKFSAEEQKKLRKKAKEATKELRELCFKTRDEQVPILLTKDYQDQIEKFGDELDEEESAVVNQTQIPQLLEDLGNSLSQNIRENICTDLEKAAKSMQKGLLSLQNTCSKDIDKVIGDIIDNIDILAKSGNNHCRDVQIRFRRDPEQNTDASSDTYRAVCRKHGDWKVDSKKSLNQRFLQVIDAGLARIWNPSMAKIQASLTEYTSKFDKQLTVFENRWESMYTLAAVRDNGTNKVIYEGIIYQHCSNPPEELKESMNTILNSLKAMSLGTQKLLVDQVQKVNDKQRYIELFESFKMWKKLV